MLLKPDTINEQQTGLTSGSHNVINDLADRDSDKSDKSYCLCHPLLLLLLIIVVVIDYCCCCDVVTVVVPTFAHLKRKPIFVQWRSCHYFVLLKKTYPEILWQKTVAKKWRKDIIFLHQTGGWEYGESLPSFYSDCREELKHCHSQSKRHKSSFLFISVTWAYACETDFKNPTLQL